MSDGKASKKTSKRNLLSSLVSSIKETKPKTSLIEQIGSQSSSPPSQLPQPPAPDDGPSLHRNAAPTQPLRRAASPTGSIYESPASALPARVEDPPPLTGSPAESPAVPVPVKSRVSVALAPQEELKTGSITRKPLGGETKRKTGLKAPPQVLVELDTRAVVPVGQQPISLDDLSRRITRLQQFLCPDQADYSCSPFWTTSIEQQTGNESQQPTRNPTMAESSAIRSPSSRKLPRPDGTGAAVALVATTDPTMVDYSPIERILRITRNEFEYPEQLNRGSCVGTGEWAFSARKTTTSSPAGINSSLKRSELDTVISELTKDNKHLNKEWVKQVVFMIAQCRTMQQQVVCVARLLQNILGEAILQLESLSNATGLLEKDQFDWELNVVDIDEKACVLVQNQGRLNHVAAMCQKLHLMLDDSTAIEEVHRCDSSALKQRVTALEKRVNNLLAKSLHFDIQLNRIILAIATANQSYLSAKQLAAR